MITKPMIKNNIWIDKLYYIFFPSAFKSLLRAVKLSLFLFCFSASINIENNSRRLIELFSAAFSEELTIEKAKTAKAVWKIKVNQWTGTGFFISENKIVTNAHLVKHGKGTEDITIIQKGNPRRLKASKIVSLSIRYDLALLEVDGVVSDFLSLPESPLNSSNVYAFGYPNGQFQEIRQTGVLTANYFFSDNFNIRGASGSPVLNEAHQLVGVLYKQRSNSIFFISLDTLKSFIKDEYFLCEDNVQECFKSLRESFEKNPQDVKSGKNSHNIYQYLSQKGDLTRAREWLEKAAEQGYALAQIDLAEMYHKGKGVWQDLPLARKWLEKAAEQGHALAQFDLAAMYYKGEGGVQDLPLARKWFEKAAEQGHALAQFDLAAMYYKGEGGVQDLPLAREWVEKAAEQGYALAQHNSAVMYYKGEGGAQDIHRAIKWFEKAAKQGHAPAQYYLALMYYIGEKGVDQDIHRAIKWFEKAAEQDYIPAQVILVFMYSIGEKGVDQDIHRAMELLEKATDNVILQIKKVFD